MSGWAAAAQAAVEIADKFIDSRSASSPAAQSSKGRQFTLDMYRRQLQDKKDWEVESLSRLVEGSRRAGLHPLFAMGSAGAGSPAISLPGSTAGSSGGSGASLSRGLSAGLETMRRGKIDAQQKQMAAIQIEREKVALAKDNIELQAASSALARAKQTSLWGDGRGAPGTGNEDVRVSPYGTRAGVPLHLRPLKETARESIPATIEVVDEDGERYTIVNPKVGDEISQGDYVLQRSRREVTKALEKRAKAEARKRARDRKAYKRSDYEFYGGS